MKRSLCILLAVVMVLVMLPATALATENTFNYYGREALSRLDNGEALVWGYDLIIENTVNFNKAYFSLLHDEYKLVIDEVTTIIDVIKRDHVELFWLDWLGPYYKDGNGYVTSIHLTYSFTADELPAAKAAAEAAADRFLAGITDSMTEYEKELYLHDQLVAHITYDHSVSLPNIHNAYGGLVNGYAVCDGYAKAFQYLLHRVGIQSFIALGWVEEGYHAWNFVRIDGKYYQTDPTWNDPQGGTYPYHAYFNLTDDLMEQDHTLRTYSYEQPTCNSTEAFYFQGNRYYTDATYTVDSIGQMLKDNRLQISVYIPDEAIGNAFKEWCYTNVWALAKKAGVTTGFSLIRHNFGDEYIFHLIPGDAAVIHADGSYDVYETVEEAIAAQTAGSYVQLLWDRTVNTTLTQDLYIDLNGFDLTGTINTSSYKVYGLDSTTNSYSCETVGYFNCTDSNGSTVIPERLTQTTDKRYLTVHTSAGYSFHRFYIGVTHNSLKPNTCGLGYKALFCGDSMVVSQLDPTEAFGYQMQLGDGKPATRYLNRRSFNSREHITLRVDNFIINRFGELPLRISVWLKLADGTIIQSAQHSTTMRSVLETVNNTPLTTEQKAAIQAMIEKYPIIKSWDTANLY